MRAVYIERRIQDAGRYNPDKTIKRLGELTSVLEEFQDLKKYRKPLLYQKEKQQGEKDAYRSNFRYA